ncbi:hypothetical protein WOLCODRAFT_82710, partial [Wolfiporia cocos MD-104 SS10]
SLAPYIYDCIITPDRELHVVWARKISGASILFLTYRYLMLAWCAIYIAINFATACEQIIPSAYYAITAFITLRIYAISGGNMKVSLLVFCIGLVSAAADLVSTSRSRSIRWLSLKSYGLCAYRLQENAIQTFMTVVVATRICAIIFDGLVLVVTWYTTYGIKKAAESANVKVSIVGSLLRDGKRFQPTTYALVRF